MYRGVELLHPERQIIAEDATEKTRTARAVAWLVLLESENVEVDPVALTYRDGSEEARIEERPDMRRSCPYPDARSLFSTERSCRRIQMQAFQSR